MHLRKLGTSGLQVSAIGLGGNSFGATVHGEDAIRVIRAALDQGVNFIDTADYYGDGKSEELIGKAVASRRARVLIATKVGRTIPEKRPAGRLSRRWIVEAVEGSLRRLGIDYIDLYQAHRPDDRTPLEETLRAMDDLVRQGKIRYAGCSNYAAWQVALADNISRRAGLARWISVQPRWNLLDGISDPRLLPASRALGFGIIPYTPLASGILSGKYRQGEEPAAGTRMAEIAYWRPRLTDAKIAAVERLKPWAEARGHTTAELAIAWLLAHPEVSTVIVGARTAEQAAQNLRAADWALTPPERDDVQRLVAGNPVA